MFGQTQTLAELNLCQSRRTSNLEKKIKLKFKPEHVPVSALLYVETEVALNIGDGGQRLTTTLH